MAGFHKLLKYVRKGSILCTVAFGGGFIGSYIERRHMTTTDKEYMFKNIPALPLFGTVSAATALTPDDKLQQFQNQSSGEAVARTSQIMKYGFPGLDNVRSYDDFVLSYDQRNRIPHWTFEHLNKDTIRHNKEIDRSKCRFKEDVSVHPFFRASNSDYKGSGFDRGHLAAAGNHRICQKHVDQTFYYTNIAPQVGGFNRNIWNDLEKHVRKLARIYANVYVCTGPLFLPRWGENFNTLSRDICIKIHGLHISKWESL